MSIAVDSQESLGLCTTLVARPRANARGSERPVQVTNHESRAKTIYISQ